MLWKLLHKREYVTLYTCIRESWKLYTQNPRIKISVVSNSSTKLSCSKQLCQADWSALHIYTKACLSGKIKMSSPCVGSWVGLLIPNFSQTPTTRLSRQLRWKSICYIYLRENGEGTGQIPIRMQLSFTDFRTMHLDISRKGFTALNCLV